MIIPSTNEVTQPLAQDQSMAIEPDTKPKEEEDPQAKDRKRWQEFRQRIDLTKMYRKKLIRNWIVNVDYRRGKTFMSQPDDDTVAVNLDWSLTKTKHAALFSQVPTVHISHPPETLQGGEGLAGFERKLNDNLRTGGIESAMKEVLPDCINAAGIGIVVVAREALTKQKQIPKVDISILPQQFQEEALTKGTVNGMKIPMISVPQVLDTKYTIKRISPADFLWPIDFTGSDFDNAPWVGYSGRLPWEEAKSRFNLKDEDKDKVLVDQRTVEDLLAHEYDREHLGRDNNVGFDEIFYTSFQYDPDATSFKTIHRLVFLHGRTEPVIDEPWNGQQVNQQTGDILGSMKKPVRVLTLTYITDEDIPPSDSAIGRAQVNELNKGRTHMNKQRARTAPWTWFDVNRLDPAIQGALMRGIWQHAIPVQGDGSRVIGTVQQPPMQQENFTFDRIAKQDLQEAWTIGSNQIGVGGDVETKGESETIQSNFATKVTMERAQVASFVASIAEVMGGLMCLYEDPASFGKGFDPSLSKHLQCSILPDSTIILDAGQKIDRLTKYLNQFAKTGYVNIEPVLREITTLIGLDHNTVVIKPQPQQPETPNISVRMTGSQDLMNPLMLAFLIKTGQAPDQKGIEQAKELIQHTVVLPQAPPGQPTGDLPPAPPTPLGEANPDAGALPKITQRSDNPAQPPQGAQ
jgi:hypothetical protein